MLQPLRLVSLAVIVTVVSAVCLNLGLAWMCVFTITHLGVPKPQYISVIIGPEGNLLKTNDGKNLRVWYYTSRDRAAILAMGAMDGCLGNQLPPGGFLIRNGYGILQDDSRACALPPDLVTLGLYEVHNAAAGFTFLASYPKVNFSRICAFGFSLVGAVVVVIATCYPGLAAMHDNGDYYNLARDFVELDEPENYFRNYIYMITHFLCRRKETAPSQAA